MVKGIPVMYHDIKSVVHFQVCDVHQFFLFKFLEISPIYLFSDCLKAIS